MLYDDIYINGDTARARSYAKINLTLDVLGRRKDGYHEVRMLMQSTALCDNITVRRTHGGIRVASNVGFLPTDGRNIAYKAAQLFLQRYAPDAGVRIFIEKNIPVAAGLAGGSGNAAAVLCAMDRLFGTGLSDEELATIGLELGADVPYCIMGGTALCEGIGEKITPAAPMPRTTVLLVKPPISVSTAEVYAAIDSCDSLAHPDTDAVLAAIRAGDTAKIAAGLSNVMEAVTAEKYPVIRGIKEKLMKNGALGAVMSGSGPTVFGIFDDERAAKRAADSFYTFYKEVYLTKTYN